MRVLLVSFISAVLLFFFGFAWWAATPAPKSVMRKVDDEEALGEALREACPESGVYVMPWMPDGHEVSEAEQKAFEERHAKGPLAQVFIVREGKDPQAAWFLLQGFLHFFALSLMMVIITRKLAHEGWGFGGRLGAILTLAFFATFARDLSHPIWFHHDWGYWAFHSAYAFSQWLVAGPVVAGFAAGAKPAAEDAAS